MKKLLIILTFLVSTIFFIDNVSAESIFDSLEGKYYIVHKWVGNASGTGNDYYYVGIFNNMPTIKNETIYDSEYITYYRVSANYNTLINFIETGNSKYRESKTTNTKLMQLNTDSSNMLFSNFDLIDENGNTYFAKNEYQSFNIENMGKYQPSADYNSKSINLAYIYREDLTLIGNEDLSFFYNNYDYYLIPGHFLGPNSYLFTDYPELIHLVPFNYFNNVVLGVYIEYDENKPVYMKRNGEIGTITSNHIMTLKNGFFKTNIDNLVFKKIDDYSNLTYSNDYGGSLYTFNESNLANDYSLTIYEDYYWSEGMTVMTYDESKGYSTLYYGEYSLDSNPTIDITKESETTVTILEKEYITDVTLKIDFGSIDNDNYLYMFKYGIDSEWETIKLSQSTSFTKTYSTNDTLYVQVMDRNTNEVLTTSTFGINSINYDYTPYITIEEITPDACILDEYIICQALQINSHIVDFDRYSFIVIDHTQNTTEEIKEMTVYKTYYVNSTIEVRIVDNTTGEVLEIESFGIKTISEDTSNLGQHITYSCKFAKYGTNYLCDYYFYNYNQDSYRYYYRTSTSNFVELNIGYGDIWFDKHLLNFYSIKDGLAKLQEVSYNKNTTVYFEIIDKETEEVIYTATFKINYDLQLENADKKDIFDIFKDFNNDNSTIKTLIDNIWTSLKGSTIYEYILILIVGALIVIIIKAANR